VESVAVAADGTVAFAVNEDAHSKLYFSKGASASPCRSRRAC
jgi:hypothetical protein